MGGQPLFSWAFFMPELGARHIRFGKGLGTKKDIRLALLGSRFVVERIEIRSGRAYIEDQQNRTSQTYQN